MKQIIKKEGLPDVVFHSLRHTSVTYKLKLSGGDIKGGPWRFRSCTGRHGNPEMAALLTSLAKSMNLNAPPEMVLRSTKNMKKILDVGFII